MKNETIEIKKENLLAIYNEIKQLKADDVVKKLETMFGKEIFKSRDVTERIKTFEDAVEELGNKHPFVREWCISKNLTPDLEAYIKLRIICAALNEGWEPKFIEDEYRNYPWFFLYTQDEIDNMNEDKKKDCHLISTGSYQTGYAGFGFAGSGYAPSMTDAGVGSRLCLKSEELAVYCGKQFINLWADLYLIRKEETL